MRCLLAGRSIRRTARRLGVHPSTAFRWRHRVLAALRRLPSEALTGIVEADETYVRYSEKGSRHLGRTPRKRGAPAPKRGLSREQVPIVTALDRGGHRAAGVAGRGVPTAAAVALVLGPVVRPGSMLCTDGARSYAQFCTTHGVTHAPVGAVPGGRVRGVYHIQHVNAYHQRLKDWMRRFRGVATKYLANYVAWHGVVDAARALDPRAARDRLLLDTCAA
jgi:hypothetical protein